MGVVRCSGGRYNVEAIVEISEKKMNRCNKINISKDFICNILDIIIQFKIL